MDGRIFSSAKNTLPMTRMVPWVSFRRPRQKVSKGGSVKAYVNCVSMSEYGLWTVRVDTVNHV